MASFIWARGHQRVKITASDFRETKINNELWTWLLFVRLPFFTIAILALLDVTLIQTIVIDLKMLPGLMFTKAPILPAPRE